MDEQLYFLGSGLSLADKVDKAIANLREYETEALRRDPVNGYYPCDSYGKDSGVILHLAKRAGVRFVAHHNLTTLDPPELIRFGRKYHPETVEHKPTKPLVAAMLDKSQGPPTRLSRWCCEQYKENAGDGKVVVFGVRAAESARRKANWKTWQPMNRVREGWILNPILYWTDADVWNYTRSEGVPYCSLYDEGMTRLGCIGCPMAGDARYAEFKRWPKYEAAWKRGFERFWTRWHGAPLERERWVSTVGKWPLRPISGEREEARWVEKRGRTEPGVWTLRRWYDLRGFTTWQELWSWWMEELPEPEDDTCTMGLF